MRSLHLWVQLLVFLQLLGALSAGRLFERNHVPKDWVSLGRASPSSPVRFTVGLRAATVEAMADEFWAITTPTSPHYLDQLTREEVEQRFGASHEDRQLVQTWLSNAGVVDAQMRHVSSAIEVTATVDVVERLFNTEMRVFRHSQTRRKVIKAWGVASLPDDIHAGVDLVTGLSSFPVPPRKSHSPKVGQPAREQIIIPQSIRAFYQIRDQKPGSSAATQSVIEFGGQWFNNSDTALYAQLVGYTTSNTTIAPIPPEHVVGVNNPLEPGVESSLDVQMIAPTNLEVQTWFWYDGDSSWLYEFALHMLNTTNAPQVNSISYGLWEGMQCFADPLECELMDLTSAQYTAATNALFMRLGMQGITIVVASGDSGANSRTDETCAAYNLRPEYPASSPYVTTVGATMIVNASYGYTNLPICSPGNYSCITAGREVAVSRDIAHFTSGGGFSNITGASRPSYQDTAVKTYLSSGVALPPTSYYNQGGRGEPDVAAVGSGGLMVIGGEVIVEGGTSMASPIFAGVASLLNQIVLSKTGKSIGFLNPLLYQMAANAPDAFHDITEGDNICPEEFCGPQCKGYVATKGWDPVTGLGTPNAARMEAYVSQLMDEVLARKNAAKTVKATEAVETIDQPQKAEATMSPTVPIVTRNPSPQSYFWSPSSSREVQSKQSSASPGVTATGAVYPSQTWQGLQPITLSLQSNESLIVALSTGEVLDVNPETHVISGNYSIDQSLSLGGLATSSSAAYLLLLDELYGNVYIDGVNIRTGDRISRVTLSYPFTLGGVDQSGKTAVTSAGGSAIVLLATTTGARRGFLYNATWNVVTLALNPANNDVLIVSSSTSSNGSTTFRLVGLAAGSNSTRFSTQLSSAILQIGSIAIDQEGRYAYVLYVAEGADRLGPVEFIIEVFSVSSGRSTTTLVLPDSAQPAQFITAGATAGTVYWIDGGVITRSSIQGRTTRLPLGRYPLITNPSDVAVTAEGAVLVAQNAPFQILEFNSTGGVVVTFPLVNELTSGCSAIPYLNIAVEASGNVLMPICNSTILVLNARGRVIERLSTGNGSLPRAVTAGPRGSILFTDDNNPTQIQQLARNGTIERHWTAPFPDTQLLTVHWDNSTQDAWAVDATNSVLFQWPILQPTSPKVWNLTAMYGRPISPYSVAVDSVHKQLIVTAGSGDLSAAWVLWLDLAGGQPVANFTFPVDPAFNAVIPTGVAVSRDGSRVYATDYVAGAVYVFNTDQRKSQEPLLERVEPIASRNLRHSHRIVAATE